MAARTFSVTTRPLHGLDLDGDSVVVISVDPKETPQGDGRTSVSMGFPVLYVSAWVADGETFARKVAELLGAHYQAEETADA